MIRKKLKSLPKKLYSLKQFTDCKTEVLSPNQKKNNRDETNCIGCLGFHIKANIFS